MLEASQNTSNGLDISGCVNTGAEVKYFLKVWKALSHCDAPGFELILIVGQPG
jgi:hypothetical protein